MSYVPATAAEAQFRSQITDADLRLTPAAQNKLAELLAEEDDVSAIRVFVAGGGCGGMSYGMTFTDGSSEYDCVLQGAGFAIYIDAVALNFLKGVEIDFVERPSGASFVFNNAFAVSGGTGTCGACGAAGGGCA